MDYDYNKAKYEFLDELTGLGVIPPVIESIEFDEVTLEWKFTLLDGQTSWGLSPALSALSWVLCNVSIDTLNDRVQFISGMSFERHYRVTLRDASRKYA